MLSIPRPSAFSLCDAEFASQAALQEHYLGRCPHAVMQCRFQGCTYVGIRSALPGHEEACPTGRARCMQCLEYTDKVRAWRENDGDHMAASDRGTGGSYLWDAYFRVATTKA